MFDILIKNGQTWIICGGRDFDKADILYGAMYDLTRLRGLPDRIVSGHCRGADMIGEAWADEMGLDVVIELADWEGFGRAAGPRRNQKMIDKHKPHLVVAFPGGRGTADMVARARKAGIDVAEIKPLA